MLAGKLVLCISRRNRIRIFFNGTISIPLWTSLLLPHHISADAPSIGRVFLYSNNDGARYHITDPAPVLGKAHDYQ